MAELLLKLSSEEREVLVQVLQQLLKEVRVEEHRTRTLTYRESVVEREKVIEQLLSKLKNPAG